MKCKVEKCYLPRRKRRRRAPSQSSATTRCRIGGRRRGRQRGCPGWWPVRRKRHRAWRIFCCKDCSCCSTLWIGKKWKNWWGPCNITYKRERKDEFWWWIQTIYSQRRRRFILIPILSQRMKNLTRHKRARYRLSSRVQRWERLIILAYCDMCHVI